MLQHLTTALHAHWQSHFSPQVPTHFPGVATPIGDAPAWVEIWLDTLNSPPRRPRSPQQFDLLITVHCFSRHPENKVEAQSLIDAACNTLAHRHIEISNGAGNSSEPLGTLTIREPQVRDLTRTEPPAAQPTQHLVLSLSATAQFCPLTTLDL